MPSLDFIVGPRPCGCSPVREAALGLLQGGTNPTQLALVTFREDAAAQLANDLAAALPAAQGANLPRVLTPTGLARDVLRRHGRAPVRRALEDLEEQLVLAQVIAGAAGLGGALANPAIRQSRGFAADVNRLITQLKQLRIDPPTFERLIRGLPDEPALRPLAGLYAAYAEHLERAGAADYRGAVWLALEALEGDAELRGQLQSQWRNVLIDGAEDLSPLEWELLCLLGAEADVVAWADPEQSIYGFRGVVREPWEALRGHGAHAVACEGPLPGPVSRSFAAFADADDEAAWIAERLRELVAAGTSAAVIVRSRAEADRFESALVRQGAPIDAAASGAGAWLMARFLRDALELLTRGPRLLASGRMPRAEALRVNDALMHLLSYAEADAAVLAALGTAAASARRAGQVLLQRPPGARGSAPGEGAAIRWAREWYSAHFAAKCDDVPGALLRLAAELKPGWRSGPRATHDAMRALGAFLRRAARLQETFRRVFGAPLPARELLEQLPELVGRERATAGTGVSVLTCHEAKGRAFDVVFVPGLAEDVFPQTVRPSRLVPQRAARALCDRAPGLAPLLERPEEALAEERRAFHAAQVCAAERVLLSCHLQRAGKPTQPSRFFIEALPAGPAATPGCVLCQHRGLSDAGGACEECVVDPCPGRGAARAAGAFITPATTSAAPPPEGPPVLAGHEDIRLSASALNAYSECPRRYFLERLLRLRDEASDAATYGTAAHEVLHRVSQLPQQERTAERAAAEVRAVVDERRELFASAAHRQQCERDLTDAVGRYLDYADGYAQWRTLAAEAGLEVELADDEGQLHAFTGRLDLVAENAAGIRAVVDFKTSTALAKGADTIRKRFHVRDDEKPPADRDYQLALYALAPLEGRPVEQLAIQPIWPSHVDDPAPRVIQIGREPGKGVLSREELDDISQQLANLAREMKRRRAFPPNPKACRNCPFADLCDRGDEEE